MDLLVTDKSAMHPHRKTRAAGHVEHVTHAKQCLGSHLIQDGAAVYFAADLKAQAGGNVGLDQACDHVHAGTLGGQYQVNAGRPSLLGQPCNQLFNLLANHHHQVSQLINHHHNVRQALQRFRLIRGQTEGVANHLAARFGVVNLDVIASQIAHAHLAH